MSRSRVSVLAVVVAAGLLFSATPPAPASAVTSEASPHREVSGGVAPAATSGANLELRALQPSRVRLGEAYAGNGVLVQVATESTEAGRLEIGVIDAGQAATGIGFTDGSRSMTVLAQVDDGGQLSLRSSVDARASVRVLGRVSQNGRPGAGGTTVTRPFAVIDTGTGTGGALPAPGTSAIVPVAGAGDLPTSGITAVWLSVEAQAAERSGLVFDSSGSGVGASAGANAIATPGGLTTLVLAPLGADGTLVYRAGDVPLERLRATVLGWVADASAESGVVDAGVVPVTAERGVRSAAPLGAVTVRVGDGIPDAVDRALVRVEATGGAMDGHVRLGTSFIGSYLPGSPRVDLAAGSSLSTTVAVPVDARGQFTVTLPHGARLVDAAVIGYISRTVSRSADRDAPEVTITSPTPDAVLEQSTSPAIVVTGRAADAGSGVREITVRSGRTVLGKASVDPEGTWSLEVPSPAGRHEISATAEDGAGRTATVRRSLTIQKASSEVTVLAPETHVLTPDEEGALLAVTAEAVELSGATALRAGDIVVVGVTPVTPEGLLRRVTSVELIEDRSVLRTAPAALTDAIYQTRTEIDDAPLTPDPGSSARAAHEIGASFSLAGAVQDSGPFHVAVEAEMGVSLSFELVIGMSVSWSGIDVELETFSYMISTSQSLAAEARVDDPVEVSGKKGLRSVSVGGMTVPVGPVPVVILVSVDPSLYFEASTGFAVVTSWEIERESRMGLRYSDGEWTPTNEVELAVSRNPATIEVTAAVEAGLELQFNLKLYGLAGPYAALSVGPRVEATADLGARTVEIELALVSRLTLGAELKVLDTTLAEFERDLGEAKVVLYRSSAPIPDGPGDGEDPGTPGEGGDPGGPGEGEDPGGPEPEEPGSGGDPDGPGGEPAGLIVEPRVVEIVEPGTLNRYEYFEATVRNAPAGVARDSTGVSLTCDVDVPFAEDKTDFYVGYSEADDSWLVNWIGDYDNWMGYEGRTYTCSLTAHATDGSVLETVTVSVTDDSGEFIAEWGLDMSWTLVGLHSWPLETRSVRNVCTALRFTPGTNSPDVGAIGETFSRVVTLADAPRRGSMWYIAPSYDMPFGYVYECSVTAYDRENPEDPQATPLGSTVGIYELGGLIG